jgi:hypothetical protein
MTLEEQVEKLSKKTIELNERCNKIFEKLIIQADGLNAKVELNKYTTSYQATIHEVFINGIQTMLSEEKYNAIKATL